MNLSAYAKLRKPWYRRKLFWTMMLPLLLIPASIASQGIVTSSPGPTVCLTPDCSQVTHEYGPEYAGRRVRACLTVTDTVGQRVQSCHYLTIRGKCTPYTADLDGDFNITLDDTLRATSAWQFRRNDPTVDIDGNGVIDLDDVLCVTVAWNFRLEVPPVP